MPIQPVPIPSAPPAPSRSDPATFEERNDAAVEYQFNTLPGAIDQQAEATYINAQEAYQDARAAEAAAQAAVTAAGAEQWVSGQHYPMGATVWSEIDMQTYRRRVAGSSVIDPSLDPANWVQVGAFAEEEIWASVLAI